MPAAPFPEWDFRIVAPDTREEIVPRAMLERLARADMVVFGEQHDDAETHRAQLLLLEAIGRLGRPVVLSLEMFERDVQPVLDDHLAGRIAESELVARSRPWPRYATDYRPLVELARSRGWPVVAANVPRPIASAVGRVGLAALDTLSPAGRLHAAREVACPEDDYRARFLEQMRSHSPGSGPAPLPGDTLPTAVAERFYLAQCVKDETMAESIVEAWRRAPSGVIVFHVTGAFHSDYAQGTVDRVRRREPGAALVVVTAVPVRDPAMAPVAPHGGRADFVIYTRRRQ
ncbi:MAG TPA: ChaN family lipoprotein [Gemmatimonadaceae bacterium]|nr:ChaN family lipoprotein [Gemmatimonadaceae bacterium]